MTAIKNCAFGQTIPMQDRSESSAKYKVGDRVRYGRTECEVVAVRVSVFGWAKVWGDGQ